jgi:hypothetical protein
MSEMKKRKPEPSRRPKKINGTAWWYENLRGIEVVQEYSNGVQIRTITTRIPWTGLLKAAKRCGKLPR